MRKASTELSQSRGLKRRPLLRTSSPLNPQINRGLTLRLVQRTGALQRDHRCYAFPLKLASVLSATYVYRLSERSRKRQLVPIRVLACENSVHPTHHRAVFPGQSRFPSGGSRKRLHPSRTGSTCPMLDGVASFQIENCRFGLAGPQRTEMRVFSAVDEFHAEHIAIELH
jgi:hypothetical protein